MAGDTLGPTYRDLQRAKRRMFGWGAATVGGLVFAAYSFFGGFMPAYQDYKAIKEELCMVVKYADGSAKDLGCGYQDRKVAVGSPEWNGFVAYALIVDEGETALRDCFNNNTGSACTASVDNFNFHGIGTSATAVGETDGGCLTEATTQYNPDNTRATGTQSAPAANQYRTVGTNTVDASITVEEFCLMDVNTGAGNLWSRILTSTQTLSANDALETTYTLTID